MSTTTIDAIETQLIADVAKARRRLERARGVIQRGLMAGEVAYAETRLWQYRNGDAQLMQRMPGEALEDRPNADPLWYDDND